LTIALIQVVQGRYFYFFYFFLFFFSHFNFFSGTLVRRPCWFWLSCRFWRVSPF
jgi:hypothetical protein